MVGKVLWSLMAVSALTLTAGQAQGSPYDRVAYWDSTYATSWAGDGVPVRDALVAAGYRVVNAAELKTWMDGHIADKNPSVVVFCRDDIPVTVGETQTATCTLRRYLDAGGKVVWYSDIPLYYQALTGGGTATWGTGGSTAVLGFNAAGGTWDVNQQVKITEVGARWGLTTTWSTARPAATAPTTDFEILATAPNGNAAGWVKHYVPGDTFRGFVRIDDHSGVPVNIAQLMAVAEYFVAFNTAAAPIPADGATDVQRGATLSWTAGQYPSTHDVYFGTAFADVNSASRTNAKGVLASQGQADATFDPPGSLAYGQTYYWRIDEVNTSADGTIYKGGVWSFTVEPYGYPLTKVTATASSSQPSMGPENTVNGSGMTGDLARHRRAHDVAQQRREAQLDSVSVRQGLQAVRSEGLELQPTDRELPRLRQPRKSRSSIPPTAPPGRRWITCPSSPGRPARPATPPTPRSTWAESWPSSSS